MCTLCMGCVYNVYCAGISQTIFPYRKRTLGKMCVSVCTSIKCVCTCVCVCVCVYCRAHKLMGQVCDKEGDLEKALVHYNRYVYALH